MTKMTRLPLLLVFFASAALAQAPGWSRGQQLLNINYEECVRRASIALQNEGYRVDHAAGAFAVGQRGVHTAVISCHPAPEGRQHIGVNIVVASNGEGGGSERQRLQAQMERPTAQTGEGGGGGGNPPARAGRYLNVSLNGRRAVVDWANAPTTSGAWVSIVPAGTNDGTHVGRWVYTESRSSGRFENGPLDPGSYEARFYADGGYGALVDRVRFEVSSAVPGGGHTGRYLNVQLDGRSASVYWSNAPTTDGAWVSVVPAGSADGTHVGKWTYTNRKPTGVYESGALTPGDYEARFYGDGGYGAILDRVRFRVN